MMKFGWLFVFSVILCLHTSAFAKIVLPMPADPACQPTPAPTPHPTPVPTPGPTPKPTPKPIYPQPPANLPPDGPDPVSSGSVLIDRALAGELPKSYLPLWQGYPWQKIAHPRVWTAFAVETLRSEGQPLLQSNPSDISLYCPNYPKLASEERLVFWARFISVLAEQESSYNPLEITYEPSIGSGVFSTGFLMLSLASAQSPAYGCSMIHTQDDLFDWRKNMACAIKVMGFLVHEDGAIAWGSPAQSSGWRGVARYWAPLREMRLKTAIGRQCLDETVDLRRSIWDKESLSNTHPSTYDSDYHSAGESRSERFLRMVNELPLCQPGT